MSLAAIFAQYPARLNRPNLAFVAPGNASDGNKVPRIYWKPVTGNHEAPKGLRGPGDASGPMLTRRWDIRVEIWANDLTETEDLTNAFLAVTHDLLSRHGYALGKETWVTEEPSFKGCICVLDLALLTPIPKTALVNRPVTLEPTFRMGESLVPDAP